ncbi:hypothetical protein Ddc_00234 [Ditylenchus destructor]|nr:hypothetical protein Ddc_00234 [Ditylenchus destructor]
MPWCCCSRKARDTSFNNKRNVTNEQLRHTKEGATTDDPSANKIEAPSLYHEGMTSRNTQVETGKHISRSSMHTVATSRIDGRVEEDAQERPDEADNQNNGQKSASQMLTAQQVESGVVARKKVVSYHPIDVRKKSVPCKTGKEAKDYFDLSAQKMSPDNTLRDVAPTMPEWKNRQFLVASELEIAFTDYELLHLIGPKKQQ